MNQTDEFIYISNFRDDRQFGDIKVNLSKYKNSLIKLFGDTLNDPQSKSNLKLLLYNARLFNSFLVIPSPRNFNEAKEYGYKIFDTSNSIISDNRKNNSIHIDFNLPNLFFKNKENCDEDFEIRINNKYTEVVNKDDFNKNILTITKIKILAGIELNTIDDKEYFDKIATEMLAHGYNYLKSKMNTENARYILKEKILESLIRNMLGDLPYEVYARWNSKNI